MHPWHHALLSAKKWGGSPEDYLAVHNWFDASKAYFADIRHRALRHHAEGIYAAEQHFGVVLRNSQGRDVPVRFIGEQHVREDLGFIPSVTAWLSQISVQAWMLRAGTAFEAEQCLDIPPDFCG